MTDEREGHDERADYERAAELITRSYGIATATALGHTDGFDYDDAEAAFLALERLLELHRPCTSWSPPSCLECLRGESYTGAEYEDWPCATALIVLRCVLGTEP